MNCRKIRLGLKQNRQQQQQKTTNENEKYKNITREKKTRTYHVIYTAMFDLIILSAVIKISENEISQT